MSFFGKKETPPSPPDFKSAAQDPARAKNFATAKYEMEGIADTFNRLTHTCFNKCTSKYNDKDLPVGEASCIDRCTVKYMLTQQMVGELISQNVQEQNAAGAAMAK